MRTLQLCDLFAGAGGSSSGGEEALSRSGYRVNITAVNHWNRATDTFKLNHPEARVYCTGVDNINPRDLYKEGELDVLLASPECTHFSVARGGRPLNEQSRATAMCVIRWAEALRPTYIVIENVPEFRTWGPLIRKRINGKLEWVADPKRKGDLFRAFKSMLEATGYKVDHRVIRCADFGDPTTRKRLFIIAARGSKKIFWPNHTHLEKPEGELLFANERMRPWATARDHVIDWTLSGRSIYDRKKPLSPKTMERIYAGLMKFGLSKPFLVPGYNERDGQAPRTHDIDKPCPTVAATGHTHLAESVWKHARFHCQKCETDFGVNDYESNTVTCPKCGNTSIESIKDFLQDGGEIDIESFIIPQQGDKRVRSVNKPLQTVTTESRGIGLAQPFLVNMKGQSKAMSLDKPAPTVTAHAPHLALGEPCIIKLRGGEKSHRVSCSKSVNAPVPSLTTGNNMALAQFIMQTDQTGGNGKCVRPMSAPMFTVVTKQNSAKVDAFLVQVTHGNGKEKNGNNRRVKSVRDPMPAVTTRDNEWGVVEPALLPQHGGGALRPVSEPVPTVATDGAIALIEPCLIKFYGTAKGASIDKPLDTVTAKDRFALVRPMIEIQGERYMLDIRFRMLQPHELAAAQGFKRDYKFAGTKTEIVKMIGNAVPRRTMRALVLALWNQSPDITPWVFPKKRERARKAA
jgi:DNA (cytosine-5)-methyltransferase 1